MAFSRSVIRSQAPAKCEICETERPIKWKCINCDHLLCNHCKEKVHPKFPDAKYHRVVNIKDVGKPIIIGTFIELNIIKQYQTEQSRIEYISYCHDDSLWICSRADKVLQRVKPEGTKLSILSSFNIKVYGMAVTQSNNLLISTRDSKLKQISSNTDTLTDSVYNVSPFHSTAVHITSDNKVLVGGVYKGFPEQGRRVVILMNQNGEHERVYEHDHHKQPVFTFPKRITHTSNGNIHVEDQESGHRRKIVVLGQDGEIINIYAGNKEINKNNQFKPKCIVTTPRDNVIVADVDTHTLHILNDSGLLMTYYKTRDLRVHIEYPCSLAFTPTGQLFIGCTRSKRSTTKEAKIYEVTISGC